MNKKLSFSAAVSGRKTLTANNMTHAPTATRSPVTFSVFILDHCAFPSAYPHCQPLPGFLSLFVLSFSLLFHVFRGKIG